MNQRHRAQDWVKRHCQDVVNNDHVLLREIADRTDQVTGVAPISYSTLADAMHVSVTTVKNRLNVCVDRIEKLTVPAPGKKNAGGRGLVNAYRIVIPEDYDPSADVHDRKAEPGTRWSNPAIERGKLEKGQDTERGKIDGQKGQDRDQKGARHNALTRAGADPISSGSLYISSTCPFPSETGRERVLSALVEELLTTCGQVDLSTLFAVAAATEQWGEAETRELISTALAYGSIKDGTRLLCYGKASVGIHGPSFDSVDQDLKPVILEARCWLAPQYDLAWWQFCREDELERLGLELEDPDGYFADLFAEEYEQIADLIAEVAAAEPVTSVIEDVDLSAELAEEQALCDLINLGIEPKRDRESGTWIAAESSPAEIVALTDSPAVFTSTAKTEEVANDNA